MTVVILNGLGTGSSPGINVDGASGVATLTIDAPNTFEFLDGSSFLVDNLILGEGELVADGTASNPIVFRSIDANPSYAAWQGFLFTAASQNALQGTSMAYCDIEDATGFTVGIGPGSSSGEITIDGSCATPVPCGGDTQPWDGGAAWPSITHCSFTNYGGCGIFTESVSTDTEYADGGNTFDPAAGPADAGYTSDVCGN
jgi:hypothetical protein